MEHLIKQYSCFFGETLHQKNFFPSPLFNFHHLNVLIHKFYPGFSGSIKKPTGIEFLLAFFCFVTF